MKDEVKQHSYLSGATLFMMLVEAKNSIAEDGHDIANYEILAELAKIYSGKDVISFDGRSAVEQASKYRSGASPAPSFMGFYDSKALAEFDDRYKNDYESLLESVKKFVDRYLYIDKENPWLIKALFDIVENDGGIDAEESLFIDGNNVVIKKADLHDLNSINASAVILGLWYYTLHHEEDKTKNKAAYDFFTVRKRDNSKAVDRNLFEWPEDIKVIEKICIEEDAIDDSAEEDDYEEGDYETEADEAHEGVYLMDGDIAPDLADYRLGTEDIVYVSATEANMKIRGPFAKYIGKAYRKFSNIQSYIYRTERPFRDFYVCNDISGRIRDSVIYTENGFRPFDGDERPISNVTIFDFGGLRNIIVGQGGLGKSMMMNHLFLSTVDKYMEEGVIPIFISLCDYIPKERSLLSLICEAVTRFDTALNSDSVVKQLLEGHNAIFMDGLDEVKKESLGELIRELDILNDSYGEDNMFVVSSRDMPDVKRLKGYKTYVLLPLTEEQAFEMVRRIEPEVVPERIKENFIRDIKSRRFRFDAKEKKEYLGNPLFLTLMLLTYAQTNNISTERYLFYEDAYKAMATLHDGRKGITRNFFTGLNEREFQCFFGQFCVESYLDNKLRMSRRLMDAYFQKVIDDNGLNTSVDMFFRDVTEKLCLMYLDGDEYRFIHRSFQEYFAAYFISTLMDDEYADVYSELLRVDSRIVSDDTISMLYGINKRKFERYIVIPFLEQFTVFAIDDEDYREFLKQLYPSVEYATGELESDYANNELQSAIYKFITENYKIREFVGASDFEDDYSFADDSEIYYVVDDYRIPSEYGPDTEIVDSTGLWRYMDPDGEIRDSRIEYHEAGYVCTIKTENVVRKILNNGLWEIFNDESFPLKIEFRSVQNLLKELKEKYSEENTKKRKFGLNR